MWDAVSKKQSADEFEYVKVPRHFRPPFSNRQLRTLTNRNIRAVVGLQHFIDREI
jgi:hypothetical protein